MHPKSKEVWGILESAGTDQSVIEKVCAIVDQLAIEESSECQTCLRAHAAQVLSEQEKQVQTRDCISSNEVRDYDPDLYNSEVR